jgi:hypothetical protein
LDDAAFSSIAAKVLYRKAARRLEALTEDEVLRWRSGAWRIADSVIERYRDRLLANRSLALSAMDLFSPQEVSEELVRRRPDLARYWRDEVFFRRLQEEKDSLRSFLSGPTP